MIAKLVNLENGVSALEPYAVEMENSIDNDIIRVPKKPQNVTANYLKRKLALCHAAHLV